VVNVYHKHHKITDGKVLFICFVKVSTFFSRMSHLLVSSFTLSFNFLEVFKVRYFVVCVDATGEHGLTSTNNLLSISIINLFCASTSSFEVEVVFA